MNDQAIKIRKVCDNCKMNALFTNTNYDLADYGTVNYTAHLHCENCGEEE